MVTKFPLSFAGSCLQLSLVILLSCLTIRPLKAQMVNTAQLPSGNSPTRLEIPPPQDVQPSLPKPQPPSQPGGPLPPPSDLLRPSNPVPTPNQQLPSAPAQTFIVERFDVVGSTVFRREQLTQLLAKFTHRPISFAELLDAGSAITQLYIKQGYITSGTYIPPQTLTGGVVKIQVVEGRLEDIRVTGTRRLNSNYVRSRLAIVSSPPVNQKRLLEALQLLQQNPLIQNLSAELSAGSSPGASVLLVKVTEAKTFNAQVALDNGRTPSVGSFQRRLQLREGNLLGLGDSLTFSYTNTDGSNTFDTSYTFPLNPRNGTLTFNYGNTSSNVIERPFNTLDIKSAFRYYELTFRQPVIQTPTQEFAFGLTASRRESDISSSVFNANEVPLDLLSPGADEKGRTRVSALRFFQEWTNRSSREVIAARSQFSFGNGAFSSTINAQAPDSRFFSWLGQAQWVRLLAPDTLLLVRGNLQLADRPLVPIEQFGLGGLGSVRGYRQDLLLTDNGFLATAELQYPILRIPKWHGVLQAIPFVDVGTAWGYSQQEALNQNPNTLAAVGLGLQLRLGNEFTARLDWGIPLVSVNSRERTWQENGLYFSVLYSPFSF
ncbi:MAG: ShlB/FhaC/HecB family hemolysin secretion/activation protein [Stigonema ocellatum SAG 48.90 = DSM 106950]|nr:ShlB/FhaC/HecB family hemolysin secretion/activation protein [Stigonema ocellatum SAG 48.90 = DSM 106950]